MHYGFHTNTKISESIFFCSRYPQDDVNDADYWDLNDFATNPFETDAEKKFREKNTSQFYHNTGDKFSQHPSDRSGNKSYRGTLYAKDHFHRKRFEADPCHIIAFNVGTPEWSIPMYKFLSGRLKVRKHARS
jgi:hypothetical protein